MRLIKKDYYSIIRLINSISECFGYEKQTNGTESSSYFLKKYPTSHNKYYVNFLILNLKAV